MSYPAIAPCLLGTLLDMRIDVPKLAPELSDLSVRRLTAPGFHAVGGVSGLHLQVLPSGARTWILRVMVGGKRRDMGLGGYPDVTLAKARENARDAKDKIRKGIDPIAERLALKSALCSARGAQITFDEAAAKYIEAMSHEWKNAKHQGQWAATLREYASPFIGSLLVSDIKLAHVEQVLSPIWTTKTETATRVRGRIEAVLNWATVRGYRHGENPARWKGHLDKLLPRPSKVAKVEHFAALPWQEVGAFMEKLRERTGTSARAVELAILTAARSNEVRGATWAEIDLDAALWIIPGDRMKASKEHRIPLPADAVALLRALPRIEGREVVFASPRGGKLSDMSLTAVLRRMAVPATVHGFRSTFRDWAAEATNYPRDVAEMALAHSIGDKVEAAYRRGDLFEKRRRMMDDWAKFCRQTSVGADVTPIRSNTAA
ncbi:tyrosine-type recombinase/integrase [Methyloversatilis sp. RAC08]|uniref:tyrosine-type recombinase/integrase n=1 Tax=Methyloversatilis sp. RAC08 TaxID=1842540 RepID=UPI001CBB7E9F|nr:site-specific integrase [Methyloversatilis sp. RAC08]